MLKIGLTGGIGSGKTAVSDLFEKLGITIIDTDVIARELVSKNTDVLNDICKTFGDTIINKNGSLDRSKLAQIVFNDKDKKKQLEAILHPKIRSEVKKQISSLQEQLSSPSSSNYCVIVIPLLFETGFNDLIDRTLVVLAEEQSRIQRITERDHRDLDEIQSIINSQVDDKIRIAKADDLINNDKDFKTLESQVLQLHKTYEKLTC